MATTPPLADESSSLAIAGAPTTLGPQQNDPFNSASPGHFRFSTFNAQLFALPPDASPSQVRLTLEAHLAETDRRMEEAGKLGHALVQQRNELAERLKEVEKIEADGELSDELRQKLIEIEKDYNEVAQKSARAFLPKTRASSNDPGAGSPHTLDSKSHMRSTSPSKFEAQAAATPSKLNVPNRRARNQPSNRIHDIEFAAEISTSLIAQVRNLQSLLAEKDEELKDIRVENSKLEYEAEGFQQRLKALDDSESRYKDENWNLETQVHELMTKEREAADREKKLTQMNNLLQAEKNMSQQKIDEIKLAHSKLLEEHAAAIKHHDIELGTAKRNIAMGEAEREALQRRIDDLTGQNQELAKAVSASMRARNLELESIANISDDDFETAHDNSTPEPSPPPSPVKITPRHAMLETETLKTSLAHAQRTIQSLRTNVHREKTERLETRRLLQEARDELERMRNDTLPPPTRRARKTESKEFKKPPRLLGGLRSTRSEVFVEDPDWEDQPEGTPPRSFPLSRDLNVFNQGPDNSDHFQTANETSDATFDTANEVVTETEFHTGVEEFSSDDAETETETDTPSRRRAPTGGPSNMFSMHHRSSIDSTASTEDEEFYYDDSRPSTALPPLQSKFPLRINRGAFRRSRRASEDPLYQGSPGSFANGSDVGTPQNIMHSQSLAAELGDFDGSDNESNMSATPSKRSIRYRAMTPPPHMPRMPRVSMVDSGMMTDPLDQVSYADLTLSTLHSRDIEPLPEPDTHAAELAAIRTVHEEQLRKLATDNTLAHEAALEALKSQHLDELASAKQALESLSSDHAETTKRAIADIHASYSGEIESLKSKHADEISKTAAQAQALHDKELESLKLLHVQQLEQKEAEIKAALASDLEALSTAHAAELSRKESESKEARDAEIHALKAAHEAEMSRTEHELKAAAAAEFASLESSHADALSKFKAENEALHAAEVAALVEAHSAQIHTAKHELSESHAREVENLKSAHAQHIDEIKRSMDGAYSEQLEALRASHAQHMDDLKSSLDASHAEALESLKASHAQSLVDAKEELVTTHAAAVASMAQSHSQELEDARSSLQAVHSNELASMKTAHDRLLEDFGKEKNAAQIAAVAEVAALAQSHRAQIDDLKSTMVATHTQELEHLATSHVKELEELEATKNATHAQELEELQASQAKALEDLKTANATHHAQALEQLEATYAKQLESSTTSKEAAHAQELEHLQASHAKQLEDLEVAKNAAHAQELELLKTSHVKQLDDLKTTADAAHAQELESLTASHAKQLEDQKTATDAAHFQELEDLKASYAKQLEELKTVKDAAHATAVASMAESHSKQLESQRAEAEAIMSRDIAALKDAHAQEIEMLHSQHAEAHAKELEGFRAALAKQIESSKAEGDAAHDEQIEALNAAHAKVYEAHQRDASIALSRKSESHEREMNALKSEHAAARTKELAELANKHAEDLKTLTNEHEASKSQLLQELSVTHKKELEALRQEVGATRSEELESLSAKHLEDIKTLTSEHEASKSQLVEELSATHKKELEALRQEIDATRSEELESLSAKHLKDIKTLASEHETSKSQLIEELSTIHRDELDALRQEVGATHSAELEAMGAKHLEDLKALADEHEASKSQLIQELTDTHRGELEALRQEVGATHSEELQSLGTKHLEDLENAKREYELSMTQRLEELTTAHSEKLAKLQQEGDEAKSKELAALGDSHAQLIDAMKRDHEADLARQLQDVDEAHTREMEALRQQNTSDLSNELATLKTQHGSDLEKLKSDLDTKMQQQLAEAKSEHSTALASLRAEHEAALEQALVSLKTEHEKALETAKTEQGLNQAQALEELSVKHTEQLDRLKQESDATLSSELEALKAQHVQDLEAHLHEAAMDKEKLLAIHAAELEALRSSLATVKPTLEYSPMSSIGTEPIEIPHMVQSVTSQPLMKAAATTMDSRLSQKPTVDMSHQGCQTNITAVDLDQLVMKSQGQKFQGSSTMKEAGAGAVPFSETVPSTPMGLRVGRSSMESLGRVPDPSAFVTPEPVNPLRRPASSASVRSSILARPPLPSNHREVIEAARSNSAHGGRGTMGPPLLPASAYRPASRPQTPSSIKPAASPGSIRGTIATRASRTTTGYADVYSPSRVLMHSRQSSISSFASEIDTRFNIHNGMGAPGFGPSTDPRMIQAVTQTMIGEYLWKYTRKTGRGEMSEKRHRRFFWVHPYTRALYWSDSDPGAGGRGEMKAKSVAIEAVRVVADDNPMPPGLHRKSLVVMAPGRTIKFTCTTGQRHETWFNALSYLLLRSGNESKEDAEEVAGNFTQDDVDEFNPAMGNTQRPRPPPSLSSYNSRTTRNESPSLEAQMGIPTLTPTHERDREIARSGTLGKLSGYWRSSRGTLSGLRSRSHQPYDRAIYEAMEVPDSAEDVRQMIEQQDRESDRLENVRACCDGKHDVGTIPHTTKRGRLSNIHTHSHTHMPPVLSSTSQTNVQTTRASTT